VPIPPPFRRFSIRRILILGVLAAGVVLLILHLGQNPRFPAKWALAILAGAVAGGMIGSERRRRRHDLQPDILAALFPPEQLLQLDQVHLAFFSAQLAGRLRVVLIAQNIRDVAGLLKVQLAPAARCHPLAARIPSLAFELPPAAVVMARLDRPLRGLAAPRPLRLAIKGSAGFRGGRAVRFARRRPVRSLLRLGRSPSLSQWVRRGGRIVKIALESFPESHLLDPLNCPPAWTLCTLWIPADPAPLATISRTLAQVRKGSTSRFLG
jgi:hypothetical protein